MDLSMFEIKVLQAGSVIIFRVVKFIKLSTHVIKKRKKPILYEFFVYMSLFGEKLFKIKKFSNDLYKNT